MTDRRVFSPVGAESGYQIIEGTLQGHVSEVALLPPPTYDPNLEFDQGHRWTARDEEFPPTLIYRRGVGEWVNPSIGWMRQALYDPRLDPEWLIWPNMLGNLGICVYQPKWEKSTVENVGMVDHGTSWYVGYIDVVTGKVHLWEGDESKLQDFADNYPFRGAMLPWGIETIEKAELHAINLE